MMMSNMIEAWGDNRLRCSSSRGVFKTPDASFVDHNTMQLTDGSFVCSVSPSAVMLVLDSKPVAAIVTANSFGDNGVWIQISCPNFWLELYVPTLSEKEIQRRAQR